jgi:hypothetical protein
MSIFRRNHQDENKRPMLDVLFDTVMPPSVTPLYGWVRHDEPIVRTVVVTSNGRRRVIDPS